MGEVVWSLVYLVAVFGGICAVGALISRIDAHLARRGPARRRRPPPRPRPRRGRPPGPRSRLVTCRPGVADPGRRSGSTT
ncbi:hypothetical protein ACFY4C_12505 [Actinomadura viridis]|uniref:hypothetical protein n=1 Tax=Actinomadura viridis TaxID=58110 RepID=UPI0036BE5426